MLILVGAAGCHQRARLPATPVSVPALGPVAVPRIAVQAPVIRLLSPDLRLDLNWLDLDEFMPPGARRVGPTQRLTAELSPIQRTRFPSTEVCAAPNQRFVLFHDGMKRKDRNIFHWLLLLKDDPAAFPNMIFGTRLAFEVSWSPDSARFAVTHFVGDNSSEVFVVDPSDLVRHPIDVRPWIEEHFPQHLWSEPMFLKAYRWSHDGRLVVRAIARARQEPFELFGCEVLASFPGPGTEPRTTYLRGYIKPQDEVP